MTEYSQINIWNHFQINFKVEYYPLKKKSIRTMMVSWVLVAYSSASFSYVDNVAKEKKSFIYDYMSMKEVSEDPISLWIVME